MPRLKSFKDKPGTILDAFNDANEHIGTIMIVSLPPVCITIGVKEYHKDSVPIVVLKQALPKPHQSRWQSRGHVGLWTDVRVEYPT